MEGLFKSKTPGAAQKLLFFFALSSLVATLLLGLTLSIHRIFPEFNMLPFQVLRPLHTLFALSWVMNGSLASVFALMKVDLKIGSAWILPSLFLISAASILSGNLTGREYIVWPLSVSIILVLFFLFVSIWFFVFLKKAYEIFAESTWMIALGFVLLSASLVESNYYLFDESISIGRDIAIQWHAIDSLFGALNLIGYGLLSYMLRKELAAPVYSWKFQVALIVGLTGLLLTFGHHFYPSPQPEFLKTIAFTASMVAIVSIWLKSSSRIKNTSAGMYIVFARYSVLWTLFSIVTGVLMSVPAINQITHGTYFVVAHSMGSLIGVNTFILFSVIFYLTEGVEHNNFLKKVLLYFNASLMLFVTLLSVAGVMTNMSIQGTFLSLDIIYILIFASGILLFVFIMPIIFAAAKKL